MVTKLLRNSRYLTTGHRESSPVYDMSPQLWDRIRQQNDFELAVHRPLFYRAASVDAVPPVRCPDIRDVRY